MSFLSSDHFSSFLVIILRVATVAIPAGAVVEKDTLIWKGCSLMTMIRKLIILKELVMSVILLTMVLAREVRQMILNSRN